MTTAMFDEVEILKVFLRESKLRFTPQRQTILEVFLDYDGHAEVEDLFLIVQKIDPAIGIATVYRTMNDLVRKRTGYPARGFI